MKFSDLEQLFYEYDDAKWSPSRMAVNFGCDCGCGGDSYTVESWDDAERRATEAINKMKALCDNLGIEYDGIE